MSAATQEKQGPVTFRAKGANFTMVIKPSRSIVQQDGSRESVPGQRLEFAEQPVKGEFTTSDPELIAEIRSRPGLNLDFWEVGNEPFAQPDPEKVLDEILQATIDLDDEALQEIEIAEATSFQRPTVLKNVRKARARVQSRIEEEDEALANATPPAPDPEIADLKAKLAKAEQELKAAKKPPAPAPAAAKE